MVQAINTQSIAFGRQSSLNSIARKVNEIPVRPGPELPVNSVSKGLSGVASSKQPEALLRDQNVRIRNAHDGVSLSQVADGGLEQVKDQLQQMRELAIQSANSSSSDADRESLNAQFTALNGQLSRIASATSFNGVGVLASEGDSVDFQAGSSGGDAATLSTELAGVKSVSADIGSAESAIIAITKIDAMIANVSSARASVSAAKKQFEVTIDALQTTPVSYSATRDKIFDTDHALQAALTSRSQMLERSGNAIDMQANVSKQNVSQLLG